MAFLRWIGILLVLTTASAAAVAAAVVTGRGMLGEGDPLPGVAVQPYDLDAAMLVAVDGKQVAYTPRDRLALDAAATRRALVAEGRGSYLTRARAYLDPRPPRIVVEPVLVPVTGGAEPRLQRLLVKPTPARIVTKADGFDVVASRPGQQVDLARLTELLHVAALGGAREVGAPLVDVDPIYTTAVAEAAAARADELLADPVSLRYADTDVGALDRKKLISLARFRAREGDFQLGFDAERLARTIRPALAPWRKRATNARFVLAGTKLRVRPSKPGLDVNPSAALASVRGALESPDRVAELRLRETRADLTTKEADALGIRERISTFTTDMGTSSSNRIHNVQLMARYIDGTIVRPGATFSFNESVGPRTEERGFLEGQMIVGSLLLPSIGGGVCQTATTLFNNAWELGFPIVERHNHSFFISHYPTGRDATVSWGGPDFAFRNDLKTGILIKTTYTASTLTFSFYGTDPGRKVVTTEGPKLNWRQPQTTYAYDPYAPRGSVRTVAGSNQSGFDITVTRKVIEHGKLLRTDAVTSNYVAVGPTTIYGPGRSIPGPYFILPRV